MQPQEVEVWYILPAIRRELVKELKKQGLRQRRIAELLGITDAAVSQYISQKRAADVSFDKEILQQLKKSARAIIKDNGLVMAEIQKVCSLVRKGGLLCKIHHKKSSLPITCKICLEELK